MNGKIIVILMLLIAVVFGAGMYYMQVYGYYYEVEANPGADVVLVSRVSGAGEPIAYDYFAAIDADSSPIRYRACFTTPLTRGDLGETYTVVEQMHPRVAPGWFDCFDAVALGAEIEAGTATTFLSVKNIHFGVDRVVAVTEDGRGYAWHELNDCGEKAYDGTVIGEECPPIPDMQGN